MSQSLTLAGTVTAVSPARRSFTLRTRSDDLFEAFVGPTTNYQVLTNLDMRHRDVPDNENDGGADDVAGELSRYVVADRAVVVSGVYQEYTDAHRYEARTVHLLHPLPGDFLFESTDWWLVQIAHMADRILDHLFDARRSYSIDDFSKFYRTNLNILGQPTEDKSLQECAVLSRLIYDLSSAYLLIGSERYFLAARAAVGYMREAFRTISHDGSYCVWAHARTRTAVGEKGETRILASQNDDDRGGIPLYEQIYALAGLAQYYRVTLDWKVLQDIRRTVAAFQRYYWDPVTDDAQRPGREAAHGFAGTGGYYSHLDPGTMRPDAQALGDNCARKNWNSVGDHIPAYLVNVILALDPLPPGHSDSMAALLRECVAILEETCTLILERFPDPDSDVPYVNERFYADWTPDHTYRWQQNRAVVGHNLKIAWNLTRCAYYWMTQAERLHAAEETDQANVHARRSEQCLVMARRLADAMADVGLDALRGGVFDLVEREPEGDVAVQFPWAPTKDFWQQEQGILAYLILHGATEGDHRYLQLARECSAFWNLFFLDRERQGYFFRTTEDGLPVIDGHYGMKSSHAIGYHAFELGYLAHLYTRVTVAGDSDSSNAFSLHFKISEAAGQRTINVLPDFMPPGRVRVTGVRASGFDLTKSLAREALDNYQVVLEDIPIPSIDGTIELEVDFQATVP